MYNESEEKIIKDINLLERQLITRFGVDEPVRLVNDSFQKKFKLAQTKYNISLSFPDKSSNLRDMASMMYRAWLALEEQLAKEGVLPLPVDTYKIVHKETDREVFVCKDNGGKRNVLSQFGKYSVVVSTEELLNMIDKDTFEQFLKLTEHGLQPTISSYKRTTDDEQEEM